MSDNAKGIVNYWKLLCLRQCCADPSTWVKNATPKCEMKKWTGEWMWFNFNTKGSGVVHDGAATTSLPQ